jgi:hypothetical protein
MKCVIIFLTIVFCLLQIHKSDIPTHCLTSQVTGKWIFKSIPTKRYNSLKDLYNLKCGIKDHTLLSSIYNQYKNINEKLFTNSFKVDLRKDMTAVMKNKKGKKIVIYY